MGVRLDDKQLIKVLRNCSTLDSKCEDCPMYDSDPSNPVDSLGCSDEIALLAANRLEALITGTTDIPTSVKRVRTNRIHFVEPMRIPTVTQQEHDLGTKKNGKPYVYDSAEIKEARMAFRSHLAPHRPEKPLQGPVYLEVRWYFLDKDEKHEHFEFKTTKPDTDNLIKMFKDEMARLGYFKNDAQVAAEFSVKQWTRGFEGLGIDVYELEGSHDVRS